MATYTISFHNGPNQEIEAEEYRTEGKWVTFLEDDGTGVIQEQVASFTSALVSSIVKKPDS